MATKTKLPAKRALFAAEYQKDFNATQAAIRAGYSPKTARNAGYECMEDPRVQEIIQAKVSARTKRLDLRADRLLEELALLCYSDVTWFAIDADGKITLSPDAPEGATRALQMIDTSAKRIRLHDKNSAIEKGMRHLGLLTDRMRIPGTKTDVPIPAGATIVVNFPDNGRKRSA